MFESFAFVSMRRIFYACVAAPGLRESVTSQEASASSPGETRGWDVFTAVCLGEVDLASGLHLFGLGLWAAFSDHPDVAFQEARGRTALVFQRLPPPRGSLRVQNSPNIFCQYAFQRQPPSRRFIACAEFAGNLLFRRGPAGSVAGADAKTVPALCCPRSLHCLSSADLPGGSGQGQHRRYKRRDRFAGSGLG